MKNSPKAFLKERTGKFRLQIACLTALSLLTSALALAFSYSTKFIVNGATEGSEKKIIFFVCLTAGLLVLRIILGCVQSYLSSKVRARITADLRKGLFKDVVYADALSAKKYHSGEILNRFSSDIAEVAGDVTYIAPTAASVIVRLAGTLALLFTMDVTFALVFLGGSALTVGIVALYRKKIRVLRKDILSSDGKVKSYVQETITSSMTVKAYDGEKSATERCAGLEKEHYKATMRYNAFGSVMSGVYSLIGNVGLIFSIVYFGVGVLGSVDYGSALAVILLLLGVQQPVNTLSAVLTARVSLSVSAARLEELSALSKASAEKLPAGEFVSLKAENVSFSYGDKNVVSGADFSVKRGEKVCLEGGSGQGKTTFFALLTGAYTPNGGKVEITTDKGEFSPEKISGLFAYVPQGNYLFSGTIRDNLTCFAGGAVTDKSLEKALSLAEATFVYELPDGLDTVLTERGGGLSEGQLQRLSIARAIASNRQIILFDEATSALDKETEESVVKNLVGMSDKTCIFISHRKKPSEYADRTVKIIDGKFYN
mgnify:CR=1 FL=1